VYISFINLLHIDINLYKWKKQSLMAQANKSNK